MLPEDIHPVSRCRLPPPRREDFDDAGKAVFDTYVDPKGGSIRGLQGPGGIQLHSPRLAEINRPGNSYLRFECGLSPREREVAILITARECDSRFEWAAHEPELRKCGVPEETIQAIKHGARSTACRKRTPSSCSLAAKRSATARCRLKPTSARSIVTAPKQLVDLVALMGKYAATAAMLCVFDMQLDEGETALLPIG